MIYKIFFIKQGVICVSAIVIKGLYILDCINALFSIYFFKLHITPSNKIESVIDISRVSSVYQYSNVVSYHCYYGDVIHGNTYVLK